MIAAERKQYIIDALHEGNIVTVSQLSKDLKVTNETIRHDLEKLEAEELIWRVHGGAYLRTPTNDREVPVDIRKGMCIEEKTLAARKCMEYIKNGDVLFLDNSTSVFQLVLELRMSSIKATIITNSLNIINELASYPQFEIISVGGTFDSQTNTFRFSNAQEVLGRYHAKKAFVSCSGISSACGLTDYNEENSALIKAMLHNSDLRFFMSDISKIEKNMLHVIGGLELLDYVIVDKHADQRFIDSLEAHDVRFLSAR